MFSSPFDLEDTFFLTSPVKAAGPVTAAAFDVDEDVFCEAVYRGVKAAGSVSAAEFDVVNKVKAHAKEELQQGRELSVELLPRKVEAVVPMPPLLPAAPFFLERSHLRSVARADTLFSAVGDALCTLPGASVEVSPTKFKVVCRVMREYTGCELAVRLYTDAAAGEVVVEFACLTSRSRPAFMPLFHEIAAALASKGLVSRNNMPASALKPVPCLSLPALPSSLSPAPELSAASLSPLFAMASSPCSSVRREGVAVLASVCASACPSSVAKLVAAGCVPVLQAVSAQLLQCEFEAKANCAAALAALHA